MIGAGRWTLEVRQKRTGNVVAMVTPRDPKITPAEIELLHRAARTCRLLGALRGSGGWWEAKLVERIQAFRVPDARQAGLRL